MGGGHSTCPTLDRLTGLLIIGVRSCDALTPVSAVQPGRTLYGLTAPLALTRACASQGVTRAGCAPSVVPVAKPPVAGRPRQAYGRRRIEHPATCPAPRPRAATTSRTGCGDRVRFLKCRCDQAPPGRPAPLARIQPVPGARVPRDRRSSKYPHRHGGRG